MQHKEVSSVVVSISFAVGVVVWLFLFGTRIDTSMFDSGTSRFLTFRRPGFQNVRSEESKGIFLRNADAKVKVVVESQQGTSTEAGTYSFRVAGAQQKQQEAKGKRRSLFSFSRIKNRWHRPKGCSEKKEEDSMFRPPAHAQLSSFTRTISSLSIDSFDTDFTVVSTSSGSSSKAAVDEMSGSSSRKSSLKISSQQESLQTRYGKDQNISKEEHWLTESLPTMENLLGSGWLYSSQNERKQENVDEGPNPVRFSQISLHYHTQAMGEPNGPRRSRFHRAPSLDDDQITQGPSFFLDSWLCTKNTTVEDVEVEKQRNATRPRASKMATKPQRRRMPARSGKSTRQFDRNERNMKTRPLQKKGTSKQQDSGRVGRCIHSKPRASQREIFLY